MLSPCLITSKYYISTAIPYVNAHPHIGFVLEIVQADVLARYHRSIGDEVFFLTGTDENSLKNVKVAEEKGVEVKDPVGPYGAKGVGEAPLGPAAPAFGNAIYDAIGVRMHRTPMTPESIFKEILKIKSEKS